MMRLALPIQAALWTVAGFVLLLLYGPLFLAIFFSFFAFRSNRVQWDSFSFTAYARLMDNQRIIDAVGERLGASPDRLFLNVARYGNTSAASVAIALDEAVQSGRIKRGDLVLLIVFGAGLTWGAAIIEW